MGKILFLENLTTRDELSKDNTTTTSGASDVTGGQHNNDSNAPLSVVEEFDDRLNPVITAPLQRGIGAAALSRAEIIPSAIIIPMSQNIKMHVAARVATLLRITYLMQVHFAKL